MTDAEEKRLRDLANIGLTIGAEYGRLVSAIRAYMDDPSDNRRDICAQLSANKEPVTTEWVLASRLAEAQAELNIERDLHKDARASAESWQQAHKNETAARADEAYVLVDRITELETQVAAMNETLGLINAQASAGVGPRSDLVGRLEKIAAYVSGAKSS